MAEEDLYGTGVKGFSVLPIVDGTDNPWSVYINGVLAPSVQHIAIMSEKYGQVRYGMRAGDEYPGPTIEEGKGSVTLPVCVLPSGQKVVGMIVEKRANMGEDPSLCALGGVAGIQEEKTACTLQIEKSEEKVGINSSGAEKYGGLPATCNRLFSVCDPRTRTNGNRFYRLEIPPEALELADDGFYQLTPEVSMGGKSSQLRFIPIEQVPELTGDMFLWAACFLEMLREKNQSI